MLMLLRAALHGTAPSSPPADWDRVLEIARFHQVDLFLYPAVAAWDKKRQPPAELMAGWRMAYFAATVKYEQASRQLREILSALHDAGVPVIPLKGAWLAEKIYAEGAQRPMCDFDLLVPLEQLDQARTVFENLGYTTPDRFRSLQHDKDIHYLHPAHPMTIELHWNIWNEGIRHTRKPDFSSIWQDLQEDSIGGIPVCSFPVERMLAYLAQHILHHSFAIPLRAYLDLALILKQHGAACSAERLTTEADALRVPYGCRLVLHTVRAMFDQKVPFIDESAPHSEREVQELVLAALMLCGEPNRITDAMAESADASLCGKISIGMERIFLHPEKIKSRYPAASARFGVVGGYTARLIDLVRRRGRAWSGSSYGNDCSAAEFENYRRRKALADGVHAKNKKPGQQPGSTHTTRI